MAYLLEFRPRDSHPATFWWPLVFEALGRHGLHFDDPRRLPAYLGRIFPLGAISAPTDPRTSFRVLWERLNDPAGRYQDSVEIRARDDPSLAMGVIIGTDDDLAPGWEEGAIPLGGWIPLRSSASAAAVIDPTAPAVWCWIDDVDPEDEPDEAERRLSRLVGVTCAIAELCGPGIGQVTSLFAVAHRVCTIGWPLDLAWALREGASGTFEAPIARAVLSTGQEVAVASQFQPRGCPRPLAIQLPDLPPSPGGSASPHDVSSA